MKKRTMIIAISVVVMLVLVITVGRYFCRQAYGFTGEIVAWKPNEPYRIYNLATGRNKRLTAAEYSKQYDEIGYDMVRSEDLLTITVYEDGVELLSFSTPQYSFSAPLWMNNSIYFVAYEGPERKGGSYLWVYRDGQIQKCTEASVQMYTPVVFSDTQLLLGTREDKMIVVYDTDKETITPLCEGYRPCFAEEDGSIYFKMSDLRLARYRLDTGDIDTMDVKSSDISELAYSHQNGAVLFQVTDGKLFYRYSIYELETGHHTVFTIPVCMVTGWGSLGFLNSATQIRWHG